MTNNEINVQGKYANQRREFLENHAPDIYAAMLTDGSLDDHLAVVQERVSDYVDMCAEKYRMSEEYRNAEKKDPFEAMRLLNMTVFEAEKAAYREWIGNVPEKNKEEDEDE